MLWWLLEFAYSYTVITKIFLCIQALFKLKKKSFIQQGKHLWQNNVKLNKQCLMRSVITCPSVMLGHAVWRLVSLSAIINLSACFRTDSFSLKLLKDQVFHRLTDPFPHPWTLPLKNLNTRPPSAYHLVTTPCQHKAWILCLALVTWGQRKG